MVKNLFIILGTFITFIINYSESLASYDATPYLSAHAGFLFSNDQEGADEISAFTQNNKNGYHFGGSAGVKIDYFRAEAEFIYLRNKTEGFDSDPEPGLSTKVYAYMANIFFDYNNPTHFVPYIGGGIGAAYIKFDDSNDGISLTDTNFAYQGMAGIGYNINRNNNISIGYRYIRANDLKEGPFTFEYDRHSVEAGYRFTF